VKVSRKVLWHEYDKNLTLIFLTWHTRNAHCANSARIPYARFCQIRSHIIYVVLAELLLVVHKYVEITCYFLACHFLRCNVLSVFFVGLSPFFVYTPPVRRRTTTIAHRIYCVRVNDPDVTFCITTHYAHCAWRSVSQSLMYLSNPWKIPGN
jgi:hypothetical protein